VRAHRQEALERLYKALKEKNVPGSRLELDSSPVVYTHNTCTRVRENCFFIKKTLPGGHVLEAASIGTAHQDIAVSLIHSMSLVVDFA
jgi:hypothetical protein